MPKINVRITDHIDSSRAMADFQDQCERLRVPESRHIIADVQSIVRDLEQRGRELAAIGSQFRTDRRLDLAGCTVHISAVYGVPASRSAVAWLRSLFGRH